MRRLAPDVINWLSLLAGMIALLAVPASAQQISAIKEATHEVDDIATWHRMLALRPRGPCPRSPLFRPPAPLIFDRARQIPIALLLEAKGRRECAAVGGL
jgi:hypothetical protein